MAVTTQESTQYTAQTASPPTVQEKATIGGRVKIAYFEHDQSGVGDAGSSIAAIKLPAGRIRVLGAMSSVYVNWTQGVRRWMWVGMRTPISAAPQ